MRSFEAIEFAAIIVLAVAILTFSERPQAAQVIGKYLYNLTTPPISDRMRFTADGWRAPIGW
jgi:hypothetical protein